MEVKRVVLQAKEFAGVCNERVTQTTVEREVRLMLHNVMERGGYPQLLLRMGYGPRLATWVLASIFSTVKAIAR